MSQSDCSASDEKGLIVKFGVITDVQYADVADRPAWYDATKTRYYRSSLQLVGRAIDAWNGTADGRPLFALQLGLELLLL